MTADEFEECMWDLACTMEDYKDVAGLRRTDHWYLSCDSASEHDAADLAGLNIWPKKYRFELAYLSPDQHKVVEHVHNYIGDSFHSWYRRNMQRKPTVEQCKSKIKELFFNYPVSAVQADVLSLPATYQAIIDAAGMYPPKRYR